MFTFQFGKKALYILNFFEIFQTKDIWSKTTPLHLASARTHSNCVRLLIDKSHNPKAVDENEYTPLDVCGEACKTDGKLKIILAK